MTTRVNGLYGTYAANGDSIAGDTMGGLHIYKVVTSAALVSVAAGTGTLDAFYELNGTQAVMWSPMTATGWTFAQEHAMSAATDTALTALGAVTSVTGVNLAGA